MRIVLFKGVTPQRPWLRVVYFLVRPLYPILRAPNCMATPNRLETLDSNTLANP